ncbi:37_t:CDS:2 [Diversispora eburnea]|uniref:37_t:CDS:1 n=1 Tax=Diversispora eburnea TaxID=1213867 RepID=A0A9N8W593_9GLOM|nr:37_t:CDS:2 [Diversispora eburnea]
MTMITRSQLHLVATTPSRRYNSPPFPTPDELNQAILQLHYNFGKMGIVGRIYIASEGINAQLSCSINNLKELREYYGLEPKTYNLSNLPKHLTPEEWHNALSIAKENKDSITLIDMRNHYESEIGYFESSIRPDVDTFRDSVKIMNKICKGKENEEIFMYCTAGAILLSNGFKSVNVLKGGITAYGRFVSSNPSIKSLYKGRNFTFDKRLGEPITNDIVSQCHTCGEPCDTHTNCRNKTCNLLFIQCQECKIHLNRTCGSKFCLTVVNSWDEKFGKPPNGAFDEVKPGGLPCVYDHIHRTRPKLVIERLGGNVANIPVEKVDEILEKISSGKIPGK